MADPKTPKAGSMGEFTAIQSRAAELAGFLEERSLSLAVAESCTAGLVADAIVRMPGASKVFWGSFVCYTMEAKKAMLGLDGAILERYGPVSSETAVAMARGALEKSGTDAAVSVTGLAGPGGDGSETPAGTVWIGTALKNGPVQTERFYFLGFRNEVREQAAAKAIHEILQQLQEFF
jgi:PncC family amidohydrolase